MSVTPCSAIVRRGPALSRVMRPANAWLRNPSRPPLLDLLDLAVVALCTGVGNLKSLVMRLYATKRRERPPTAPPKKPSTISASPSASFFAPYPHRGHHAGHPSHTSSDDARRCLLGPLGERDRPPAGCSAAAAGLFAAASAGGEVLGVQGGVPLTPDEADHGREHLAG